MPEDEDELIHHLQQLYINNMLHLKPRNQMTKTELLLLLEILKSLKSKIKKRMKYLKDKLNANGYLEGLSDI